MTTEKKITKAMRFADLKNLLNGVNPENGTTIEEAIEFIDYEMNLLAKKNASKVEGVLTDVQKKNEEYRRVIYDFLMNMGKDEGFTCTQLVKNVPEFSEFTNQKIAKLISPMLKSGLLKQTKGKGGAILYSIA